MARLEQGLVVGILMLLPATGGQPKIGQLNVTTAIKKNVVGFDITTMSVPIRNLDRTYRCKKPS